MVETLTYHRKKTETEAEATKKFGKLLLKIRLAVFLENIWSMCVKERERKM